ncbi:MAG: type II toxin-antitoxin system Phd/YefM family antitoxin [Deltaproteobacteria bacterium]|nr:type II toxin-antitoxin system Phd/YefM family antitoxin [Deltaproteobacteria bacterium]
MSDWQLQEAKARFSELIKRAGSEGPQRVTVHGKPTAVVLSEVEYQRLKRPRLRFVEFMRKSPLVGVELDLQRDKTPTRETKLR